MNEKKILVVGIGSSHGDDRAGWLVVDQLSCLDEFDWIDVRVAKSPIDILDWIDGVQQLVICDACRGVGTTGSIHQISWPSAKPFDVATSGTHNLNLTAALELAQRLGKLPTQVDIYVVEGESSAAGGKPCSAVSAAAEQLGKKIVNLLSKNRSAACTNTHS